MTIAKTKRRRRILAVAALVLVAGLGLAFWLRPQDRPLLTRAARVPVVVPPDGLANYYWRSDHELLFFHRADRGGEVRGVRSTVKPLYPPVSMGRSQPLSSGSISELGSSSGFLAESLDTRTGAISPMPEFNRLFTAKTKGDVITYRFATGQTTGSLETIASISPDGKWLLWHDERPAGLKIIQIRTLAFALDGSCCLEWPTESMFFWQPDSRAWVESRIDDERILSHPLEGNNRKDVTGLLPLADALTGMRPIGITNDNHLLTARLQPGMKTLECTNYALDRQHTPRHFSLPIPPGSGDGAPQILLSPQGDRIALYGVARHPFTGPAWQRRLRDLFGAPPEERMELWVCRLDGNERHLVGYFPFLSGETGVTDLRWLPGGARLSFLYQNALYTVPAD